MNADQKNLRRKKREKMFGAVRKKRRRQPQQHTSTYFYDSHFSLFFTCSSTHAKIFVSAKNKNTKTTTNNNEYNATPLFFLSTVKQRKNSNSCFSVSVCFCKFSTWVLLVALHHHAASPNLQST